MEGRAGRAVDPGGASFHSALGWLRPRGRPSKKASAWPRPSQSTTSAGGASKNSSGADCQAAGIAWTPRRLLAVTTQKGWRAGGGWDWGGGATPGLPGGGPGGTGGRGGGGGGGRGRAPTG